MPIARWGQVAAVKSKGIWASKGAALIRAFVFCLWKDGERKKENKRENKRLNTGRRNIDREKRL